MSTSACVNTARENVYIAKLALLISLPKTDTIHWPLSSLGTREKRPARLLIVLPAISVGGGIQDLVLSDSKTPCSRASCSSVTGRKDPVHISPLENS